jgi:hypothetical protein
MKANHEEYKGPNLFIENILMDDDEDTVINGMLEDVTKVNIYFGNENDNYKWYDNCNKTLNSNIDDNNDSKTDENRKIYNNENPYYKAEKRGNINNNIKEGTYQWIRNSLIKSNYLNHAKYIEKIENNNEEINEKQKIIISLTLDFLLAIKSSLQSPNMYWIANSDSIQMKEDNENLNFGIISGAFLAIHQDCLVQILEECDKNGNSPRCMLGNKISKYSITDYTNGLMISIPSIFEIDTYIAFIIFAFFDPNVEGHDLNEIISVNTSVFLQLHSLLSACPSIDVIDMLNSIFQISSSNRTFVHLGLYNSNWNIFHCMSVNGHCNTICLPVLFAFLHHSLIYDRFIAPSNYGGTHGSLTVNLLFYYNIPNNRYLEDSYIWFSLTDLCLNRLNN